MEDIKKKINNILDKHFIDTNPVKKSITDEFLKLISDNYVRKEDLKEKFGIGILKVMEK
jgi:hypothetical protein